MWKQKREKEKLRKLMETDKEEWKWSRERECYPHPVANEANGASLADIECKAKVYTEKRRKKEKKKKKQFISFRIN